MLAFGVVNFSDDIFTEPEPDPDTLANLGPLTGLAGTWHGEGIDVHPVKFGSEESPYIEDYTLEPIDPQTNGPQLLYGLRYHTHIVQPDEVETFHDQVGYWLWEPSSEMVTLLVAIPRAQVLLASGHAGPLASHFELQATEGNLDSGICSGTFLLHGFRTTSYRIEVATHSDGTWSYVQDTLIQVRGREELFHHTDRNTLHRLSPPAPNPLVSRA